MKAGTHQDEEQHALRKVLASEVFSRSPNLLRLLQYLANKYFEGRVQDIKEYNIAVEVLGRPTDFDPVTNSTVRGEAHRLRQKLKKYYEREGLQDSVVITLQPGSYVPHFIPRSQLEGADGQLLRDRADLELGAEPAPIGKMLFRNQQASTEEVLGGGAKPRSLVDKVAKPRLLLAVLALMFLGAIVVAATFRNWSERSAAATVPEVTATLPSTASAASATRPASAVTTGPGVRILAGYTRENYIDHAGQIWGPDRDYHLGGVDTQVRQYVARSPDPTVFQQWRRGEFSYNIPLKSGLYELHLYFTEPYYGPGTIGGGGETSRMFEIMLNGQILLHQFDIIRDTGGTNIADERVFTDIKPAEDGLLHLNFVKLTGDPLINAIEVLPGLPGKMRAVRVIAQDSTYTDRMGKMWVPDRYAAGGRLQAYQHTVQGTTDPDLYDGEHFGNFTYAIPVAQGAKYAATLHFAEQFFGPDNPGQGGEGSRLFDVYCNGVALLREFDIFKSAGGDNRALTKTFSALAPNAEGKLVFEFVPVRNYATLNAIEVDPE